MIEALQYPKSSSVIKKTKKLYQSGKTKSMFITIMECMITVLMTYHFRSSSSLVFMILSRVD